MGKASTPIGALIALGLVIYGIGFDSLGLFIDIPSLLIVIGGSIGSCIMIYGLSGMKTALQVCKVAFTKTDADRIEELLTIQKLSIKARKEGFLALEDDYRNTDNEYLKLGLQHVIDGTSPELIQSILEQESLSTFQRHTIGQNILSFLGEIFPGFGMVGTLIGLIVMLSNFDDPSGLGKSMSVALITTFYGALFANAIWLPLAKRLEQITDSEMIVKEAITNGLLSIRNEESPSITEAKLQTYLSPNMKTLFEERLENING